MDQAKYRDAEIVEFVQSFASYADRAKEPLIADWQEVLENYLLLDNASAASGPSNPLGGPARATLRSPGVNANQATHLRDPETANAIEALLAKLMLVLFPPGEQWIAAKKRGREDARRARTVTDLLRYAFGLPVHYRTMYTALKSSLLFGTSIIHSGWRLEERPRTIRGVSLVGGMEVPEEIRVQNFPVYDDVAMRNVDVMDFLPDPGSDNLEDMLAAGHRFTMSAGKARRMARSGLWDAEAVERAIAAAASASAQAAKSNKSWQSHRLTVQEPFTEFSSIPGIEFWGEYPGTLPDDAERWRKIVLLNGVLVCNRPWPLTTYRLPYHDITINPMEGRFWGISPGAALRYGQQFLDFLLSALADSVVRAVYPPLVYNRDDEIDLAKLAAWSPDVPIASERPGDIRTLSYGSDKFAAFQAYNMVVGQIRSKAGAEGAIQGQGLGINRASATEAARTFEFALDRPELAARYIEQECLPPIGRSFLGAYQGNLLDTAELERRIGERPDPVALADIHAEYDISFTGSRNYESQRQRLAMVDRIVQLVSIPQFANWLPMDELGIAILEGSGFDEIAQSAGTPEAVQKNLAMARMVQLLQQQEQVPGNGANALAAPGGTLEQQLGDIIQ